MKRDEINKMKNEKDEKFYFLSLVATDDKDGNRLKPEKVGPTFSSFMLSQQKIPKSYYGLLFFKKSC